MPSGENIVDTEFNTKKRRGKKEERVVLMRRFEAVDPAVSEVNGIPGFFTSMTNSFSLLFAIYCLVLKTLYVNVLMRRTRVKVEEFVFNLELS